MSSEIDVVRAAPADVWYFLGFVTPRKNHRFAMFMRFKAGDGTMEKARLPEAASDIAERLGRFVAQQPWHDIERCVSPDAVNAFTWLGVPVELWPDKVTKAYINDPTGRRPGGGYAA